MKQVVITGATSMLGRALIEECILNNTKVLAVIRKGSPKKEFLLNLDNVCVVERDLAELKDWNEVTAGEYDAFYHFAWEATDNQSRNIVDAQDRNISYTLDAVHLAHQMGSKKFIGAGSQAEYGRVAGVITPDMRVAPDSAYGVAKYAAGRLSSIAAKQVGISFIWTRIFSTYGIGDMPSTMIMYCIDCLLRGETPKLTKCEQQWDYLNCRDAAKAFYLIGQKGVSESIYHIGSGRAKLLREYVFQIRDLIEPQAHLGIGEREYAPMQVMHLCADISNLQKDTGFTPSVSFEEGIIETINWYQRKMKK